MTGFPMVMTGWDRAYVPPRSIRGIASVNTTAWDLFHLERDEATNQWARATLDSVVAAVDTETASALGCTDCVDIGFYGVADPDNEDMLVGLIRRIGNEQHEALAADGSWSAWWGEGGPLEVLSLDLAGDLAEAITAGACGLVRRYLMPRAFLPPCPVLSAAPLRDVLTSLVSTQPPGITESSDNDWVTYAVVDELDPGAVLDLVRIRASGDPQLERWEEGSSWTPDSDLLTEAGLPMVRLTGDQLADVQEQLNPSAIVAALPKQQVCKYCKNQATKRILHSEGMAYIPVCNGHLSKGKYDAAHSTPDGSEDESNIVRVDDIAASGALTAGIPGIGRPGDAERLRRYWTVGKGGAKIRWTAPGSGDFNRCYRHLRKYMGLRAKGYCAKLHKRATGVWPGDRRNLGPRRGSLSPEESLLSSVRTGQWGRNKERTPDMPLGMEMLTDGIYFEGDEENAGLLRALTAGGFPVAPPDSWYDNPKLPGKTPMVVEDSGRVYGHIATWDVTHIGIASPTPAPRSASGYKYFLTGSLKTESGKQVNVGQLTCAGGHADINGNVQAAVAHYDDTDSAVADVTCGEDQHGIWVAGSLRPSATPEQVRVFLASPPSGDWRPINGHLEMVACCSVNVPGFMNVRPQARVAGGAIMALVAAGTRELLELRAASGSNRAVLTRLSTLEARVAAMEPVTAEPATTEAAAADSPAAVSEEPVVTASVEEVSAPTLPVVDEVAIARLAATRAAISDDRRSAVRARVAAGKIPPQFLKNAKKKMKDGEDEEDDDSKLPEFLRNKKGGPVTTGKK